MHSVIPACVLSLIILVLLGYLNLSNLQDNYRDSNNNNNNNNNNSNDNNKSNNNSDDNNNTNNNNNNEELDEETPVSIEDIYVALNKMKYQKYMQHKKNKVGNANFGYSILPGTNPDSLGFCPLGTFHQGKFTGDSKDVRTKCKPCFDCQSKLGYYVSGGCLGDKDVECKFGKVPFDIFIQSHEHKSPLHNQLPLHHKHNFKINGASLVGSISHTHY